ncbi:MAG: DUF2442 domain-containing protein [Actinomycetota bacterium]
MGERSVIAVEPVGGYRLRLRFDDGAQGVVDLEPRLWGPMFESLREPDVFARVRVDPDSGTIVWPNGADLAPEMLYREVQSSTTAT